MTKKLSVREINEAVALFIHLKNHVEVQHSPIHRGQPMCTICHKSAGQILDESW